MAGSLRWRSRRWFWLVRLAVAAIAACLLALNLHPTARAQLLPTSDAGAGNTLPANVQRIGTLEVATVQSHLDGRSLFQIASPAVRDRSNPGEQIPVEIRAEQVERSLDRAGSLLQEARDPTVAIAELNNLTVLQAVDRKKQERRIRLVTVTSADADYYGLEIEELANRWQEELQDELERELRLYAPNELGERTLRGLLIFAAIAAISAAVWLLQWLLGRYRRRLAAKRQQAIARAEAEAEARARTTDIDQAEEAATPASAEQVAAQQERFFRTLRQSLQGDYHSGLVRFSGWVLFWIQVGLWYGGAVWVISIHPFLMQWRGWILSTPVGLILTWFLCTLAIRLSYLLIDWLTRAGSRTSFLAEFLPAAEMQRKQLRLETLGGVLRGVAFGGFIIAAVVETLDLLGVPTRSLLAGGAVLALAISFGAQSLVKDLVNGCLILIEDQFAVGDVIDLGRVAGLVENLNLRITQIRDTSGALITLPNNSITEVRNLTRLWSRVDFSIEIAYDADVRRALDVLQEIGEAMFAEPEWSERLLAVPDVLGVDNVAHTGILLRVWIKTAPLQQWAVGREYRYRVRLAFEANGIAIGRPQWINYTTELPPVPTLNAPAIEESST